MSGIQKQECGKRPLAFRIPAPESGGGGTPGCSIETLRTGARHKFEFEHTALHDLFVRDERTGEPLAVEPCRTDILVHFRRPRGFDDKTAASGQGDFHPFEDRRTQGIFPRGRIDRIKTHRRKDIPRRERTAVLVAAQPGRAVVEPDVGNLPDTMLGFLGIQEEQVLIQRLRNVLTDRTLHIPVPLGIKMGVRD